MTTIAELGIRVESQSAEEATNNLDQLAASGAKAEGAVNSLGNTSGNAARKISGMATAEDAAKISTSQTTIEIAKQQRELDRLVDQIDPVAASYRKLGEQHAVLRRSFEAGLIDKAQFDSYRQTLRDTRQELGTFDTGMRTAGKTSKEMAFALRGLPAQFTDIAVSLQAGQNPLTVFLQQGGQLKDMFGGIGPAAKAMGGYIVGLINPFTVAAAAAGTLAAAYLQVDGEQKAFSTSLLSTGNMFGETSASLSVYAGEVSNVIGTTGRASEVLAQMAASGKISGEAMTNAAVAAIGWERETGQAVEKTIEQFARLGTEPAAEIVKLNNQYNFLTSAVYDQIVALEEQGRTEEAAQIAQDAFSAALTERTNRAKEDLNGLAYAWRQVSDGAKGAWDSMLDVFREDAQIERLQREVARLEAGGDVGFFQTRERQLEIAKEELDMLLSKREADKEYEELKAFWQNQENERISARSAWDAREKKWLDEKAQLLVKEQEIREQGIKIGKSEQEIQAQINKLYADRRKKEADKAKRETDKERREIEALVKAYAPLSAAEEKRQKDMADIDALYLANKISAEQYQEAVQTLWKAQNQPGWDNLNKELAKQEKALEQAKQQADSIADRYDKEGAAVRKLAEERKRLQKAIEDGLDTDGRYAKALKEVDKEQQKLAKSTGVWADLTAEAFERVSERGADMWEEFLDTGKFSFDSLLDVAKRWAAEMLNAMTIKPILTSLGNWLTNSDNPGGIGDVFGGLFGGGSGSSGSGGGMGGLFNMAKNIYSIYDTITGVGTAAYTGFQSGGFSGALSSIGSHYADSMLGQAYNTVTGWFTGAAAEATAQAAANAAASAAAQAAGQAAGNSLAVNAGQYAASAAAGSGTGIFSGILSNMSGALTSPWGWVTAGVIASLKLHEAGVRNDPDALDKAWGDTSGAGSVLKEITLVNARIAEVFDKIAGGIVGDKFNAISSGSPLIQFGHQLVARLFGSGERFKTTVGSAVGTFSGDEYTGMGASANWFNGTKTFGEDVDKALHDLNETFSTSLSNIFGRFGIDETIETEARVRLRRTSGKLATDFFATIGDDMIKVGGQFAKGGDVRKGLSMFFDVVMGEGIAKAIAVSDLPQYLKDLTNGLKKAEEVSSAIDGLFQRFDTTNASIEQMGFSAFELTDKGLRAADALLDMSAALGGLENATSADKIGAFGSLTQSYMDAFVPAQDKYAAQLKGLRATFEALDETIPATRKGFMDLVTGLDLTTEEGRAAFATYMSLSEAMGSYYSNMEGLQANYLAAFGSSLEQQRQAYAALTAEFSKLGVQMPNTREGFRDLIDGIDTTTEAGQDLQRMLLGLTGSMDSYYSSLESAQASISGNIGNLREQIYLDALGSDQNRYNYMKAQADNLAALLPNLFDVGAITDVTNRITQLSSQAYGLLDESGKNTNAQEMIDFLDKIQALANEQLSKANDETAQKNAEVLSVAIGDTLASIREDFKRMLIENTSAQGAVIGSFDSIMQQTAMLVTQLSRIVQREVNA